MLSAEGVRDALRTILEQHRSELSDDEIAHIEAISLFLDSQKKLEETRTASRILQNLNSPGMRRHYVFELMDSGMSAEQALEAESALAVRVLQELRERVKTETAMNRRVAEAELRAMTAKD